MSKPIEEMTVETMLGLSEEEQAKIFMQGGLPDGDKEIEDSPDLEGKEVKAEEVKADEPKEQEKVILAKDGEHTIPYSELEAAREREREALLRAKELEDSLKSKDQLIADMQQAKKADENAGTGTEEQQKVLEEYAGEFPELMADLKPYLEGMIKQDLTVTLKSFKEEIVKAIEPIKQKVEQAEQTALENDQSAWTKAQNDFFNAEGNQVFKNDPVLYDYLNNAVKVIANDETIEGINTYADVLAKAKEMVTGAIEKISGAIGGKKETTKPEDIKKKAEEVISKTKDTPPVSLSDVPGSASAHHDEAEAINAMSDMARLNKFLSTNPDKIEDMLSRML